MITETDVMNAQSSVIQPLQDIVDQADAASATLRQQRDALQAQVNALNAQIAEAEGPGAQKARAVLATVKQILAPRAQPAQDRIAALRAAALGAKNG